MSVAVEEEHKSKPERIPFSVASALLRELGERLVGQAHIALSELVKNSYDADATNVQIVFEPDKIVVEDNGHGMNRTDFVRFWMRIGTPHKQKIRTSRKLGRVMTGSKGVGRLAVQFLAREVNLYTVARGRNAEQLHAHVNWDEAVEVGELTEAEASVWYSEPTIRFPGKKRYGTRIILTGLEQEWRDDEFKRLAREIWFLEPPIRRATHSSLGKTKVGFQVDLKSDDLRAVAEFDQQMSAILRIWHAKISGRLVPADSPKKPANLEIAVEFSDGTTEQIQHSVEASKLKHLDYEIRVFHLEHRQRFGILVDTAREYLNQFGGVHLYDVGFHLPYYGVDTDWLDIEKDHARRLSASKLLPEDLQVAGGMTFLPTNRRIFGAVYVSTSAEATSAGRKRNNVLQIQVSRDRLVDNNAYRQLKELVRIALDFYAMHEKRRKLILDSSLWDKEEATPTKVRRVEEVLRSYQPQIPRPVFEELSLEVAAAVHRSETEAERTARKLSLMGTLATAGITALAMEHQVGQQLSILERQVSRLRALAQRPEVMESEFVSLADDLEDWLERVHSTRALFASLMDEESREKRLPLRAKAVVETIREQVGPLMRRVEIDTSGIDTDLRFPAASFAEWSAIFQNLFFNALNAMLDAPSKQVRVVSRKSGGRETILVEDTGVGIDMENAEELFEPFARALEISSERRSLGLGGSGLGLTIVRMLAENVGCDASFVTPSEEYSTAFELSWVRK